MIGLGTAAKVPRPLMVAISRYVPRVYAGWPVGGGNDKNRSVHHDS